MSGTLTVSGNEITDALRALGVQGDGLSDDSSFGIWEASTNLCTNGGFETNTTGYDSGPSTNAIAVSDEQAKFGSRSCKATIGGTALTLLRRSMTLTAAVHTVSVWVYIPSSWTGQTVLLQQDGFTGVATTSVNADMALRDQWQRLTLTWTPLAGDLTGNVRIGQSASGVVADVVYIDGVQVEAQPLATPYIHTDGATATRTAARVQAPASLLDETQFAAAFRVLPGWNTSGEPHGGSSAAYLLDWRDDADNRISGYYDEATNKWTLDRKAAAAGNPGLSAAVTLTSDTETTVIFAGTASALKVSVDGGAFTSVANSSIPTLAAALVDLFSTAGTSGHFDGRCKWAALFTGTLTDADAARIHNFGNTDKAPEDFNGTNDGAPACTMVWYADDTSYEDETFRFLGGDSTRLPRVRVDLDHTNDPTSATRTWADITAYLRALSMSRGRENELDRASPGVLRATLDNRDRRFDPTYTSGAYYPGVKPMRRLRVRARWANVNYNLFHGYVERWPQAWPGEGLDAVSEITAVDAFKPLNLYDLNGKIYSAQLSGERMGTVLYDAGFGTAEYSLDDGQSTMVESGTLSSTSALSHLQDVAASEYGLFFVDGGGTFIFQDRHHRITNESATAGTLGDTSGAIRYNDASASFDDDWIWNSVMVTANGGTAETATDSSSTASYYTRTLDWPPGGTYLVSSQAEALSAAQYAVSRYKDPALRIPQVVVVGARDPDVWPTVLAREISDRLTFERRPPGGGTIIEDEHVEKIAVEMTLENMVVGFNLSPADAQSYWVLGDAELSLLGETTRITY